MSIPINKTAALVVSKRTDDFKFSDVNYSKNCYCSSTPPPIERKPYKGVGENIIGKKVGKVVVIAYLGKLPKGGKNKKGKWLVQCDCGNYEVRRRNSLNQEYTECLYCKTIRAIKK